MATADDGTSDDRLERLVTYDLTPEDVDGQEVVVEAGETVDTAELETVTIEPTSFSHVNEMVGIDERDARPAREVEVPPVMPSTAALETAMETDEPEAGSPDEMLTTAATAVLDTRLDDQVVARWNDHLDHLVDRGMLDTDFELFPGRDIVVEDGGRFHVDTSTGVLFADEIEIRRTGRITYEGRTKIDCRRTVGTQ
jgi:hypothetical protein